MNKLGEIYIATNKINGKQYVGKTVKRILIAVGIIIGFSVLAFAEFEPHQSLVLTPHIGTVRVELQRTVNPSENEPQSVKFLVMVDDQYHNSMDKRSGDLIPHLTTQQKQQLVSFMDMLWQKAENEILPQ